MIPMRFFGDSARKGGVHCARFVAGHRMLMASARDGFRVQV